MHMTLGTHEILYLGSINIIRSKFKCWLEPIFNVDNLDPIFCMNESYFHHVLLHLRP